MALRVTASPEATLQIGREIGSRLRGGDIVLLSGTLGAGKTVLARGIAQAIGAARWNGSPTFTLVNEYRGNPNLAHVDLYRLGPDDIGDLGLEEYVSGDWALVLEWPERDPSLLEYLGPGRLTTVSIDLLSPTERAIRIEGPSS